MTARRLRKRSHGEASGLSRFLSRNEGSPFLLRARLYLRNFLSKIWRYLAERKNGFLRILGKSLQVAHRPQHLQVDPSGPVSIFITASLVFSVIARFPFSEDSEYSRDAVIKSRRSVIVRFSQPLSTRLVFPFI